MLRAAYCVQRAAGCTRDLQLASVLCSVFPSCCGDVQLTRSHYFSTYPVEALLCFGADHPEQWWDYMMGVFSIQESFFNKPVHDKTPAQVQQAYVQVAEDVLAKAGVASAKEDGKKLYEQLQVQVKENGGSAMFEPLKYLIKEGRQNGIHFTPTALLNGLEDGTVSSGWGKAEWDKWLEEKL